MDALKKYEETLAPVREEFLKGEMMQYMYGSPSKLVCFRWLIEYCGRGVAITEPVEGWIKR